MRDVKITQHFNLLSEAELERLAMLIEECAEVQHVCGKILRHGYESVNPVKTDVWTNRQLLSIELGDLVATIESMLKALDISRRLIDDARFAREEKVKRYLHHQ